MKLNVTLFLLAAIIAVPALGNMPVGIYSEIAGHQTAQVPGLPDGTYFTAFERPYISPNNMYWVITAKGNTGSTSTDEVLLVGSGLDGMGATLLLQEGTAAPWAAGEDVGTWFSDRNIGINDSGHIAMVNNTSATTNDEYVVKYDGAWSIVAQEGSPLPDPIANEVIGATLTSPVLLNDGTVGFGANATVGDLPSTNDDFIFMGNTTLAQTGVTVPANQGGGTTDPWGLFDTRDFYADSTGANYIIQGNTTGDSNSDDMVVVNGDVKIQEGYVIGDFASPVNIISEVAMFGAGDWMSRGYNDDSQDWVVYNGDVVARTGDEVPGTGGGEHYSDALYSSTFYHMAANNLGDYIFGATTDFVDPDFDAVIVLNGLEVVARQGDPVDLDGNGVFDDDAYIDIFNNEDGFLTDSLMFYFTADLRDGAGNGIGQAFLALQIPEPTSLVLIGFGALALIRRR